MLILHIGTHKTGTSALQSLLSRGANDILSSGIRYIQAGRRDRNAHHRLAWAVRGERDVPLSVWDDVRRELDESDNPINILSSEAFWFTGASGVKAQLAGRKDVRLVIYLRRQDKYLQSLYKQSVAGGRKTDFSTWLGEMHVRGDYLSVVRQWADQFGN